MTDLTAAESHFAFGDNWRDFVSVVDAERIERAEAGMRRLFPDGLAGKAVIDIGCGSGLSTLAALRLGAASVRAVDIDPASVEATRALLTRFGAAGWTAEVASVFNLSGDYDVVYSWGVLHHTGDMWRAIDQAASLVRPGGTLAIAIYIKTPLCGFWTIEKRFYSQASPGAQKLMKTLYGAWARLLTFGRREKVLDRGMSADHDTHDWLGGYPYESARPEAVVAFLDARGFRARALGRAGRNPFSFLLSSGCEEYVARR